MTIRAVTAGVGTGIGTGVGTGIGTGTASHPPGADRRSGRAVGAAR